MPDTINHAIDLKASLQQIYDWTEDPTAGLLFAPANEVSDVARDAHGRMASFKTKRGTVQFNMHEYPQRWEAEYCWRGFRTRYEARVQRYGEAWVRLTVDINIQPRSFMARLSGSRVRSSFNHQLTQCLSAAGAKLFSPLRRTWAGQGSHGVLENEIFSVISVSPWVYRDQRGRC